jgi:hypothetical protein
LLGRLAALDAAAVSVLRATARIGVVMVVITGVLLASARPAEYLGKPVFLAKMAVIAVAIANALWFDRRSRRIGIDAGGGATTIAAGLSVSLWLLALGLGRWIAFA